MVQVGLFERLQVTQEPRPPVSDITGGGLNAIEALRAYRGQSIRCTGWIWESGVVVCRACQRPWPLVLRGGCDG